MKRKPGDYPTEEGYEYLLSFLAKYGKSGKQYNFAARLAAGMGLRVSEALSLSKTNLDQKHLKGWKHTATFRRKGGDMDTQGVPEELYSELAKWPGFTITRQGFDNAMRSSGVLTRAGKPIHAHALRKLWGHRLHDKDVPIRLIRAGYHHSTERMTEHYLDLHDDDAKSELGRYVGNYGTLIQNDGSGSGL